MTKAAAASPRHVTILAVLVVVALTLNAFSLDLAQFLTPSDEPKVAKNSSPSSAGSVEDLKNITAKNNNKLNNHSAAGALNNNNTTKTTNKHISSSPNEDIKSNISNLQNLKVRYYVYDDDEISYRSQWNAIKEKGPTQRAADICILQALMDHPLRTLDKNQADLYVVPIPLLSLKKDQLKSAMEHLLNVSSSHGQGGLYRHLFIVQESRFFDLTGSDAPMNLLKFKYFRELRDVIVAKGHDMMACKNFHADSQDHGDWNWLFQSVRPAVKYTFSMGTTTAGSKIPYLPASLDKFYNQSHLTLFYRTRMEKFAFGSTKYRHAPLQVIEWNGTTNDKVIQQSNNIDNNLTRPRPLPYPASIGLDMDYDAWLYDFSHSKYCLVIRGDTPHSHALLRSVQVGCIPVVVSDYYPKYAPSFPSTLRLQDFAIFINESDFLANPFQQLAQLQDISAVTIEEKIQSLQFAQQVTSLLNPGSLFVPALLKEAMLTLNPNATLY